MRYLALLFTRWSRRTDVGTLFGKLFTKAVVEKGIREALRKRLLTSYFPANTALGRL
jgi:hypothetical protein